MRSVVISCCRVPILASPTAGDSPVMTTGTSAVSFSRRLTAKKSAWIGLLVRGSICISRTSTFWARAPSTLRSMSWVRPARIQTLWSSVACAAMARGSTLCPYRTAGTRPSRRSGLLWLPRSSRVLAGRSMVVAMRPRLYRGATDSSARGWQPPTTLRGAGSAGGPPAARAEGGAMPKYLIEASYTLEGLKGLFKEGGTGRRTAIETAAKGLGGSLESMYFVFGDDDVIVVLDMPDNVSVAAFSLAVAAGGGATSTVRVLLTPEEIDAAVKTTADYRAPGSCSPVAAQAATLPKRSLT